MKLLQTKYLIPFAALFAIAIGCALYQSVDAAAALTPGSLIKGQSFSSVYYYSANGKRYVFPDEKTFKTWYTDFSSVVTISDTQLGNIMIGGNVTYRPGLKMVKIESSPTVYAVGKGGVLRWVGTEAVAVALYGANWNKKINDIPDLLFTNYVVGDPITVVSDYNPVGQTTSVTTIDVDKGVIAASQASTPVTPPSSVDAEDNSDAAHPELDVTRPENQNQTALNRIADDPRYQSAHYGDATANPTTASAGLMRGCVGTFAQTTTPQRGTLIKGSASYVYYYASNGNRYIFPSSVELQSWYGAKNPAGVIYQAAADTRACRSVKQVSDTALAAIPLRGNVTVRPNTFFVASDVGATTLGNIYIVDSGHMLRPLSFDQMDEMSPTRRFSPTGMGEIFTLPDALIRQDYVVGSSYSVGSSLADTASSRTIEQELGL